MQFTVRLSRLGATVLATVAAVAVLVVLPASASSDATISVCVNPPDLNLTLAQCGGQVLTWNQAGINGAPGAAGA
ncbi:MAG: hypothetical protein ABI317_14190, partial [Gaiellales bacterium]